MNYIDIIIILAVFIGLALGFRDGLIRKAIGLVGLIFGVFLSFSFYKSLGLVITPLFNDEKYLAEIFAFFLIFIVTLLLSSILKRIINPLDKVNRFTNQLLGGISGSIQIMFFLSGFFLFLNIFSIPSLKDQKSSLFYSKVYNVIPVCIDLIVGSDLDTKGLVKRFIEQSSNEN